MTIINLSVIVVALNCEKQIVKTLHSINTQSYRNKIEVIVVDGKSEDNTLEEARSFEPDILISEKDLGIYDAMNKGVLVATGRYCIFINAGDLLATKDIIENIFSLLSKGEHDLIFGNHIVNFEDNILLPVFSWPYRTHVGMPFSHQAAIYRRSKLLEYPFNIKFRLAADYHQLLRMIKDNITPFYVNQFFAIIDSGGVSDKNRLEVIDEWIKISGFQLPYVKFILNFFLKRLMEYTLPSKIYKSLITKYRIKSHE
jgi:glycosyltransferase involved in cell wall biosynthesis